MLRMKRYGHVAGFSFFNKVVGTRRVPPFAPEERYVYSTRHALVTKAPEGRHVYSTGDTQTS